MGEVVPMAGRVVSLGANWPNRGAGKSSDGPTARARLPRLCTVMRPRDDCQLVFDGQYRRGLRSIPTVLRQVVNFARFVSLVGRVSTQPTLGTLADGGT